jgi:sortase A
MEIALIIRVVATIVGALLFALAGWQLGQAGLLASKAWAAPILIELAWDNGGQEGTPVAPWPWADSYPIARLEVPKKGITRFILAGDNMRNLAFGPVYSKMASTTVLYGHRDTHFEFLKDLGIGDLIRFQHAGHQPQTWRVANRLITPADSLYIPSSDTEPFIFLITCYPFSKLNSQSDKRFVIRLEAVGPVSTDITTG